MKAWTFRIGPCLLEVAANAADLAFNVTRATYSDFLIDSADQTTDGTLLPATLNVEPTDEHISFNNPVSPEVRANTSDLLSVEWREFSGLFSKQTGTFEGRITKEPNALNTLLRVITSILLGPNDGFLLHASGVVFDEDRAFVLAGQSGAGKTTITKHALEAIPDAQVLSDELLLLQIDERNTLCVSGTPFWGSLRKPGVARTFGVRELHFLNQSSQNRLKALGEQEHFKRLCENVVQYWRTPGAIRDTVATLATCARTTPGYDLHFTRDLTFWHELGLLDQ